MIDTDFGAFHLLQFLVWHFGFMFGLLFIALQ